MSKKNNIFLYRQCKMIKLRNLTLMTYYYLIHFLHSLFWQMLHDTIYDIFLIWIQFRPFHCLWLPCYFRLLWSRRLLQPFLVFHKHGIFQAQAYSFVGVETLLLLSLFLLLLLIALPLCQPSGLMELAPWCPCWHPSKIITDNLSLLPSPHQNQ